MLLCVKTCVFQQRNIRSRAAQLADYETILFMLLTSSGCEELVSNYNLIMIFHSLPTFLGLLSVTLGAPHEKACSSALKI